jgi:hypothetical protein
LIAAGKRGVKVVGSDRVLMIENGLILRPSLFLGVAADNMRIDYGANDAVWHLTADPRCPLNGSYRGQSGHHMLALSLTAFDPKRSFAIIANLGFLGHPNACRYADFASTQLVKYRTRAFFDCIDPKRT